MLEIIILLLCILNFISVCQVYKIFQEAIDNQNSKIDYLERRVLPPHINARCCPNFVKKEGSE